MNQNLVQLSDNMTLMQKTFCEEYVKTLNIDKAVKLAGSDANQPGVTGQYWMSLPKCQAYIQALRQQQMDNMGISNDRVLLELAKIAFVDLGDLYDEQGCLKNVKDMPENVRGAIAGVGTREIFEQDGRKKKYVGDAKTVKLNDKIKALEMLAKHLGLFQLDNLQKQDVTIVVSGNESLDIWNELQTEY